MKEKKTLYPKDVESRSIKLSKEASEWLKKSAGANYRSVTAEIYDIIEQARAKSKIK